MNFASNVLRFYGGGDNKEYFLSSFYDVDFVLEELIEQSPELAKIHPSSVNCVRITTIKTGDEFTIFYPWLKTGVSGSFIDNGHGGGFSAGININTGIVETGLFNARDCYNKPLENHPDTGIKIRGFQIPRWNEAIALVKELANKVENIGYIGWDLALTKNGWCVVEGNTQGDMDMPQISYGRGFKYELENLINWKPSKQFWWEYEVPNDARIL